MTDKIKYHPFGGASYDFSGTPRPSKTSISPKISKPTATFGKINTIITVTYPKTVVHSNGAGLDTKGAATPLSKKGDNA